MRKRGLLAAGSVLCFVVLSAGGFFGAGGVARGQPAAQPHVPVLIIPGILGSTLVDATEGRDKLLWPGTVMLGGDIEPLRLPPSGKGNLGLDIRTTGIVGYAEPIAAVEALGRSSLARLAPTWLRDWIPATVRALSYYGGLIAAFQAADYILDEDLFTFPYDWRRDLLETSDLLTAKVEAILAQTGANAVDVVAHSMGGLIARAYVNTTGDPRIRKLIMMGTPSHGSPDAFVALHSELGQGRFLLEDKNAQELSSNWPSVFQLLPTPEYFQIYGHIFVDRFGESHEGAITGASGEAAWHRTFLENPDSSLAEVNEYLLTTAATHSARAFHERIGSALQFAGELVIIAGSGTETVGAIVKADSANRTWEGVPINGDGIVPLFSVTRLRSSGPTSVYHTTADHEGMLGDAAVGELLPALLGGDAAAVATVVNRNRSLRQELSLSDGREDEAFPFSPSDSLLFR